MYVGSSHTASGSQLLLAGCAALMTVVFGQQSLFLLAFNDRNVANLQSWGMHEGCNSNIVGSHQMMLAAASPSFAIHHYCLHALQDATSSLASPLSSVTALLVTAPTAAPQPS